MFHAAYVRILGVWEDYSRILDFNDDEIVPRFCCLFDADNLTEVKHGKGFDVLPFLNMFFIIISSRYKSIIHRYR